MARTAYAKNDHQIYLPQKGTRNQSVCAALTRAYRRMPGFLSPFDVLRLFAAIPPRRGLF
jgi:hypothetical protein